ncbi:exo-beta-N-acetylmuramidase NamZ family protein [Streptomyces sp. BI20]|uniref:exo-beta-N-acetylmuramidase NamZ family protein n=1 Tax=Streptomyces sp. BI20 TaxID=3403460 RepID=UPI003C7156D7
MARSERVVRDGMSRRGFLGAAGAVGGSAVAGVAAAGPAAGAAAGGPVRVVTGTDRLVEEDFARLRGRRVGVVTNATGITSDARHLVDVLHAAQGVDLVAVFGPEHGFRGTAQAGGSEGTARDPATGLPVYDTHGVSGPALARLLTSAGIELLVVDVQDVGARFYTYVWTLYDCLRAAASAGVAVLVPDRPNPIGGLRVSGPVLDPAYASFVGRVPIALCHGLTIGELALWFRDRWLAAEGVRVSLEVVRMRGWRRGTRFEGTGLPWVPPSPNVPTPRTALVYPGTCLFEGTTVSEGRGTTTPFEVVGAVGIDRRWAEAAQGLGLPGVWFREAWFTPTFSKFQGKVCGGVRVLVHDPERFDPVLAGVGLLVTARRVWSGFAWTPDRFVDRLAGTDALRSLVDRGADPEEITGSWRAGLERFAAERAGRLLYPG